VAASAAVLTVNTTKDELKSGDHLCSLREAVATVDVPGTATDCGTADSGSNTIALGSAHYTLSIPAAGGDGNDTGDLNIDGATTGLTVKGSGTAATVIDTVGPTSCPTCQYGDRVMTVGDNATVTLSRLTVTRGDAPDGSGGSLGTNQNGSGTGGKGGNGFDGGDGGGIFNDGTLTLIRVAVIGNTAGAGGDGGDGGSSFSGDGGTGGTGGGGGSGGGIFNNGNAAKLTVLSSTISDNSGGTGGTGGHGGDSSQGVGGNGGTGGTGEESGGGIANQYGTVVVQNSTIAHNTAGGGGYGGDGGGTGSGGGDGGQGGSGSWGGGISSIYGSVTVTNSTITGNSAGAGGWGGFGGEAGCGGNSGNSGNGGHGGGIRVTDATSSLLNSTVAGNARGSGGPKIGGGISDDTYNCPQNGNPGNPGTSGVAGGLFVQASTASQDEKLQNTIVASNTADNCDSAPAGGFSDGGHNLSFGDATCPAAFNNDPKLGPLHSNGGPTQTLALLAGSAAINKVPSSGAGCPATDQRGVSRPRGAGCDIGAYEYAPPTCRPLSVSTTKDHAVRISLSCSDPAQVPVSYVLGARPTHGALSAFNATTGRVTYTPKTGYTGPDSFTYHATSTNGVAASQKVSIKVGP
jgi:CSLREA domain-containing protein